MVVFDSTMMLFVIRPDVNPPIDEKTGQPVTHVEARINALIARLEKDRAKIIIPAPSLSELLVRAGEDTQLIIQNIQKNPVFRIAPFNTLAAIEVAVMTRQALEKGNKREGINSPWAKIKYDRQIIAIAKVNGATTIYSDDNDLKSFAEKFNINVIKLADLPVPDKSKQQNLFEDQQKKIERITLNEEENNNVENDDTQKEETE